MQLELGIFLVELLILVGCIKWIFPLLFFKKDKDISVADFLSYTTFLIGSLVVSGCLLNTLLIPAASWSPFFVSLLATCGSFLFYKTRKNEKLSLISTLVLCSIGVFLLPSDTPVHFSGIVDILVKIASVCGWTLFIYMMQKLDRIPFFSFSAFSALFLIIGLMASNFFPFFNSGFSLICFSMLGLAAVNSLILKKQNIMWFGNTLVYLLSFVIGYFGYYCAALGKGIVLPIFIAFELMEITLAFGINLWVNKKLLPLTTPFLLERAYSTGINVAKAVKKLFWTCFFFAALGFVVIYIEGKNSTLTPLNSIFIMYIFTLILLSNSYLIFSSWGKPKAEFKNLFKDIKKEIKSLSNEIKKQDSNKKK